MTPRKCKLMLWNSFRNLTSAGRSTWGIAAMNAYRAYGDDQALQHAILMWNFTLPYFVTADHVAAGKHPKKNITLAKTCGGGVYPCSRVSTDAQSNS